jgi:hypothetical protein
LEQGICKNKLFHPGIRIYCKELYHVYCTYVKLSINDESMETRKIKSQLDKITFKKDLIIDNKYYDTLSYDGGHSIILETN